MTATIYNVQKTTDLPDTLPQGNTVLAVSRTDGKKGKSGLCIMVPAVSDTLISLIQSNAAGKQFISNAIDDLRSRIASSLNKAGKQITSDAIGIDALLVAMAQENESGGRVFTAESLKAWFDKALRELVVSAVKAKTPMADDKAGAIADQFHAKLALMTAKRDKAGNRYISNQDKAACIRVLELLPEGYEHPVSDELAARLDAAKDAADITGLL